MIANTASPITSDGLPRWNCRPSSSASWISRKASASARSIASQSRATIAASSAAPARRRQLHALCLHVRLQPLHAGRRPVREPMVVRMHAGERRVHRPRRVVRLEERVERRTRVMSADATEAGPPRAASPRALPSPVSRSRPPSYRGSGMDTHRRSRYECSTALITSCTRAPSIEVALVGSPPRRGSPPMNDADEVGVEQRAPRLFASSRLADRTPAGPESP